MSQAYQMPMLFSAALPARDGQTRAADSVLKTRAISGRKCCDWLQRQGRDVSLLKMCLEELQKGLSTTSAKGWRLNRTDQKRSYIRLVLLMRPISESAYSFWPTPSASDNRARQPSRRPHITRNGTVRHLNAEGVQSAMRLSQVVLWQSGSVGYLNPDWCELLMGFPVGWTSPVSRPTSGKTSTIMSRRGRSFHRVSIIDRAFRR